MPAYNPGTGFRARSRFFGVQTHPITGKVSKHGGDDWPAPAGTPIPAAYAGTVKAVDFQYNKEKKTGWGWYVLLEHSIGGKTVLTRYAHMREKSPLKVGDKSIKKGDAIGVVGSTGGSTGNHLHFEVIVNGVPVAPDSFDFGGDGHGSSEKGPWSYPFDAQDKKRPVNRGLYLGTSGVVAGAMSRVQDGYYPIGANGLWHGGIHFDAGSGTVLDQFHGVQCINDGEVVAYQVDRKYPEIEFNPGKKRAAYSTGFALVRHRLELPEEKPKETKEAAKPAAKPAEQKPAAAPAGKKPVAAAATAPAKSEPDKPKEKPKPKTLVFYSLYMHLLDWQGYQELDPKQRPRPTYWGGEAKRFQVGDRARDEQELPPEPELPQDQNLEFEGIEWPHLDPNRGGVLAGTDTDGRGECGDCGEWPEVDEELMS